VCVGSQTDCGKGGKGLLLSERHILGYHLAKHLGVLRAPNESGMDIEVPGANLYGISTSHVVAHHLTTHYDFPL